MYPSVFVCVDQRVEWVRVEREMDQKNKIKVGTAMGWVPHLVFFFSVLSWALCLLFSKENWLDRHFLWGRWWDKLVVGIRMSWDKTITCFQFHCDLCLFWLFLNFSSLLQDCMTLLFDSASVLLYYMCWSIILHSMWRPSGKSWLQWVHAWLCGSTVANCGLIALCILGGC